MILLVTMKESQTGIVCGEFHICLCICVHQDGIFQNAARRPPARQPAEFEYMPVQMHRVIVDALILK